jgi:3-hydroxy-9,10-secoandrosta-1,3,5(10)-triene-9,17-dione monooxygenase reductase component
MTVDPMTFRQAAGMFATGVLVVTTGSEGRFRAVTVNSFTTVSLDPTLLLFCLDNRSRTLPLLQESGTLTANVLRDDQEHISRMFASSTSEASIEDVKYDLGIVGTPTIAGCLAHFHCRVVDYHLAGDHTIVLARVEDATFGEPGHPLIFFRGRYGLEE